MSRNNIRLSEERQIFTCIHCGLTVSGPAAGTAHRNHCPGCLWSRHVDLRTGDRLSVCRGAMQPVSVCETSGEWSLVHRCVKCGMIRINRIAGDDNMDEMIKILSNILAGAPGLCGLNDSGGRKS